MNSHRQAFAAAIIVAATMALSGCGILEPIPIVTPTPTPTIVDTKTYIGEVIDPAGTMWKGRDSGGDDTTLTLRDDGTVVVRYGENRYDDPNDTWRVLDGVLHVEIFLDDANGQAEYVGTWNPETSSIDAVMTTTVSKRTLTVVLVQQ